MDTRRIAGLAMSLTDRPEQESVATGSRAPRGICAARTSQEILAEGRLKFLVVFHPGAMPAPSAANHWMDAPRTRGARVGSVVPGETTLKP